MKNPKLSCLLLICFTFLIGCKVDKKDLTTIKVMAFNIWQEGTVVPDGFDAIIDEIVRADADFIALSEVRNYKGTSLDKRMITALKAKGKTYYAKRGQDTGVLSKYPIKEQSSFFIGEGDRGTITKALIDVGGREVAFYSAHLDYRHCSLYLPRGYDGSTWKELPKPITDVSYILEYNKKSQRDEAVGAFIEDAKKERAKGRIVILGGDFNEPSHLDWIEENKDLYDRRGVVIKWNNTYNLEKSGFLDAYRKKFPNPLTHPGFTFPSDNTSVDIKKLVWAPKVDDRDRIDFIFFHRDDPLRLEDITIVGPSRSIVKNKRVEETSEDPFLLPVKVWPTDHKAILATFKIKTR